MNEAETRAEHIDPALKAAGWGVVDGSRIKREYPITQGRIESHGKQGKALTADYVLIYRNTKLAVIEAKAWNEALTEGVAQAKNYAQKIAVRFTYATNGQGIYAIDMQTGNEGEVANYPTPDELWAMTYAEVNAWRDRFAEVAYEDKGGSHPGRYYQDIAIERVLSAIANKKPRILLTLATGTGKTFIAFQIAWKLFKSRWNLSSMGPEANYNARQPRILFLADRNILADQAKNAFSAFPEDAMVRIDPAEMRKKGKVLKNGSIFFTIFQTFMASAGSATGKGAGSATGKGTGSATGKGASQATIPVPELAEGCFGDYPQASAGSATGQGAGQPVGKGTGSATGKGASRATIPVPELAEGANFSTQASAGSAAGKGTGQAAGQGAGQPTGKGISQATFPVPELAEGANFSSQASAGSATGKGAGQPAGKGTGSATGKGTSQATIPVPELAEGANFSTQASAGSATGQGAGQPVGKGTSQANRISDYELSDLPEPSEGADNFMYILGCNDGSFYTGSTTNLRLRLEQHRCGEGAQYTKDRLPVKLLYCELYPRIEEAFAREKQVQGWSRMKKIALIKGDVGELKHLAQASAGSATGQGAGQPAGQGTGSAAGQGAGQPTGKGISQATIPVPELAEGCFGDYPQDFFDLIIIDECHRGGAQNESNWRGILEYFAPAVQLGLTATPKRQDNADTYAYFGEPVYIYSLKEGINDGFLVPFKVKQISTTLDQYVYTSDDRVIEGDIQTGKLYEEKDFNRTIEIKEREKKRVELFLKEINQKEKTIVFCATQLHALVVRDLINQMADSKDPNYCQRVTANDGILGEQHLSDFKDNERSIPTILTTSQKLSTGVDARNIRNIVLMRPVNSMIEFKQIIGRGTRLFEGKFYFTVFDFVKAHELFMDPEWDGEPLAPEVCKTCNTSPCGCLPNEPKTCNVCQKSPCKCPKEPCKKCNQRPCICKKVKIKLADGKERTIQHMMITSYFHPDGTPITSADFMNLLLGKLPEFFKNEAELRTLWSVPDTRKKLLEGLAEKGFGREQLFEIQKLIDAEKSDIYDVLANVVYFKIPETREVRAAHAKVFINTHFNLKQKAFLDFVLEHYVSVGVEELDQEKLTPLLRLKYNNSINDAIADLGKPEEIGKVFAGFQKYLYQVQA